MDRLPRELIDAILRRCVAQGPKNNVLQLRLVCRLFDRVLKPSGCRTLGLELSRLSRASHVRRPDPDALQTIGYHCKSLYIDLMVLRDESECEVPYSLPSSCFLAQNVRVLTLSRSGSRLPRNCLRTRSHHGRVLPVHEEEVLHEQELLYRNRILPHG